MLYKLKHIWQKSVKCLGGSFRFLINKKFFVLEQILNLERWYKSVP